MLKIINQYDRIFSEKGFSEVESLSYNNKYNVSDYVDQEFKDKLQVKWPDKAEKFMNCTDS